MQEEQGKEAALAADARRAAVQVQPEHAQPGHLPAYHAADNWVTSNETLLESHQLLKTWRRSAATADAAASWVDWAGWTSAGLDVMTMRRTDIGGASKSRPPLLKPMSVKLVMDTCSGMQ